MSEQKRLQHTPTLLHFCSVKFSCVQVMLLEPPSGERERWASLNQLDSVYELSKILQHNREWRSCLRLRRNNKGRWVWQPSLERRNYQTSLIQCSHWEKRSGKTQPGSRTANPLVSQIFSMPSGANALPSSAEGACSGAPQEQKWGHDMCHRLLLYQCQTNSLKCSHDDEASAKAKWDMNRNMLLHPEPSVPLLSFLLFYKLTYCSKSQIFRNSTGWRY